MNEGEVEIKGVAIRTFFEVVRDRARKDVSGEIRAELPSWAREALHDPVLAATWYPIGLYRELHKAAQKTAKTGSELARAIGHEGVARDFRGVYRLLAGALQPHWLMSWAPRMYGRYFRGGVLRVNEVRRGFGCAAWEGCAGFDKNLWLDMIGSSEASLEACGATHVRSRVISGGGDRDADAVVEFRWV